MAAPLPDLEQLPRVRQDIEELLDFVGRHVRGNPTARAADIDRAIQAIRQGPECNEVSVRRRKSGVELRRQNAAQFAIIYTYFAPSADMPRGVVSIRAIRHSRLRNVFRGVREDSRHSYRGLPLSSAWGQHRIS